MGNPAVPPQAGRGIGAESPVFGATAPKMRPNDEKSSYLNEDKPLTAAIEVTASPPQKAAANNRPEVCETRRQARPKTKPNIA
jgi:hypothetical protein